MMNSFADEEACSVTTTAKAVDALLDDLKDVCRRASRTNELSGQIDGRQIASARFVASLEELDQLLRELKDHRRSNDKGLNHNFHCEMDMRLLDSRNRIEDSIQAIDDTSLDQLQSNTDCAALDEASQELGYLMESMSSELKGAPQSVAYIHAEGTQCEETSRILDSFSRGINERENTSRRRLDAPVISKRNQLVFLGQNRRH